VLAHVRAHYQAGAGNAKNMQQVVVDVYYLRKGNIHSSVRVLRGIKRAFSRRAIRLTHKPKTNKVNRTDKERERAAPDKEPNGARRLKVSGGTGEARNSETQARPRD
jgi:hypothetical protein